MAMPVISLCMIVRNSARTLRECLESIRQWVDEIIIVDTGSTDETIAIAKEFGAKIYHFTWIDDFSAARNFAFKHARGKWLFWMDSDDTIDPENGRKLRALAYGDHPPQVMGFMIKVRCYSKSYRLTQDMTAVDHLKLVRNHPRIRFERRIHEQLLEPVKRLGGVWVYTDIFVVHSGSDTSPEGRQQKVERDLRILNLEYAADPRDPFTLFNLGMTYHDIGEHAMAIKYLLDCIEVSNPNDSTYAKSHALLVASSVSLGRLEEAKCVCERGLAFDPDDPELLFRQGIILHRLGKYNDAVASYLDSMFKQRYVAPKSVEMGIGDFLSRHNLAAVYVDMGRNDLAEMEYRRILATRPNYRPAYPLLARCLIAQGRIQTLECEIESITDNDHLVCELALMRASLAATRKDVAEAKRQFALAVEADPLDVGARVTQCDYLFHNGTLDETVQSLGHLETLCPNDSSTPFNLALVLSNYQKYPESLAAVDRALKIQPDYHAALQLRENVINRIEALDTDDQA